MFYRGALIGAMQLDSQGFGVFREKDLQLFSMITSQAAVAIHNALMVQRVNTVHAEHRAALESIVRGLPEGVIMLDAGGRILIANRKGEALLPALAAVRQGQPLRKLGDRSVDSLPGGAVEVPVAGRICLV